MLLAEDGSLLFSQDDGSIITSSAYTDALTDILTSNPLTNSSQLEQTLTEPDLTSLRFLQASPQQTVELVVGPNILTYSIPSNSSAWSLASAQVLPIDPLSVLTNSPSIDRVELSEDLGDRVAVSCLKGEYLWSRLLYVYAVTGDGELVVYRAVNPNVLDGFNTTVGVGYEYREVQRTYPLPANNSLFQS